MSFALCLRCARQFTGSRADSHRDRHMRGCGGLIPAPRIHLPDEDLVDRILADLEGYDLELAEVLAGRKRR